MSDEMVTPCYVVASNGFRDSVTYVDDWWLLDHGISIENVIYYSHTDTFCFGWRDKCGAEFVGQVLEVISEFPYPYEIKCADGRKLEGGKG